MPTPEPLPPEAYAAALASVPGIGPKALRSLLDRTTPDRAWRAVLGGRAGEGPRAARWRSEAQRLAVEDVWAAHTRRGIEVLVLGSAAYPAALATDPEAPAVLFAVGDARAADSHPRVAIVGTRSATRYGLGVAAELGAELAGAGVTVVSGLALGIDGAAHEGALAGGRRDGAPARAEAPQVGEAAVEAAPPLAVVAGGLDTVYPPQHARLWQRVASAGAILSEAAVGTADLAWRFPQRNRIIAALADVVVVVESHARGGALHTVQAAATRGIPVGAVPGAVRSPASVGTNGLLADGCFVVRDATDVLVAIGLARAAPATGRPARRPRTVGCAGTAGVENPTPAPRAGAPWQVTEAVLDAVEWEPASLEQILRRTGLPLDRTAAALERLRAEGRVRGEGGWWERC